MPGRALAALVLLAPSLASAVELWAGAGVGSRRLFYRDARTIELRSYDAQAFPVISLGASAFPLQDQHFGEGGLEASWTGAAGLSSRDAAGRTVPTGFDRMEAGPTLRLFVKALRPSLSLRYGTSSFSLDGRRGPGEGLPAYAYDYARVGGRLDFDLGVVRAGLGGGYLAVLNAGGIAARFRDESARGVDADAAVELRLLPALAVRVRFSYTHFAHSMQPLSSDAVVAFGALDQYLSGVAEVVLSP